MSYVVAIRTALICFPVLLILLFLPYMIREYHKYGSVYWYRGLILFSFIFYLMVAYFLVILPLPTIEEVLQMTSPSTQLIPFDFISTFINESGFVLTDFSTYLPAITSNSFYVPVFNILLFIPFGVYLHYYFEWDLKKCVLASFLLSLFFELTQLSGLYFIYPRGYRLFDVDDLLLNTFGGFLGYFLGGLFLKFLPSKEEIDEKSLELGSRVSIFRRSLCFILDFLLVSFFTLLLNGQHFWLLLLLYFGVLPIAFHGQTIIGKFFHLKVVSISKDKVFWYQYLLRSFLFGLEFLFVPFGIFWLYQNFLNFFGNYQIIMTIFLFIGIGGFYLVSFFKFLFHKYLLYEKISDTKVVSTIKKIIQE